MSRKFSIIISVMILYALVSTNYTLSQNIQSSAKVYNEFSMEFISAKPVDVEVEIGEFPVVDGYLYICVVRNVGTEACHVCELDYIDGLETPVDHTEPYGWSFYDPEAQEGAISWESDDFHDMSPGEIRTFSFILKQRLTNIDWLIMNRITGNLDTGSFKPTPGVPPSSPVDVEVEINMHQPSNGYFYEFRVSNNSSNEPVHVFRIRYIGPVPTGHWEPYGWGHQISEKNQMIINTWESDDFHDISPGEIRTFSFILEQRLANVDWLIMNRITGNMDCGLLFGFIIIPLKEGWSLMSYPVNKCFYDGTPPSDQSVCIEKVNVAELGFDSLSSWFSSVVSPSDAWQMVIGVNGVMDSSLPNAFHSLKYMSPCSAYWVKIKEGTGGSVLSIDGTLFNPNCPIYLQDGWVLVGCPLDVGYYDTSSPPVDAHVPAGITWKQVNPPVAEYVFGSIAGKYDLIIGETGVYNPNLDKSFSSLHFVAPGYGYWIKMKQAWDLTYPQDD